jgi:putative FmdB family regulatory protein
VKVEGQKENVMPAYDYRCKDCGEIFEQTLTIREHEQGRKPACPKCKSRNVQQQPSRFQAVTAHKS